MAQRTLVIVESPGKTRKINKILGDAYTVRASLGHVRDLPTKAAGGKGKSASRTPASGARASAGSGVGLDVSDGWRPSWQIIPGKEDVVRQLEAAGSTGTVYLATDLDREGEAIAWHLADILGGDPSRFRRVTFSEITAPAVLAAFEKPRTVDQALVRAQMARRFLDRIVGYELSPLLCQRLMPGLSAGRVQSAALKVLVDRDERIRVFSARAFYGVDVHLTVSGQTDPVVAQLVDGDGAVLRYDERGDVEAHVERLAASVFTLADVDRTRVRQKPKAPFTTSMLQQAASSRLKASVSDTMAAAQKLYEAGAITYMRTDAVFVAPDAQAAARSYLQQAFGADAVPDAPPSYAAKSGAQEAHEAIRPTNSAASAADLAIQDPLQARLYDLIRRRLLASQMHPALIERVTWTVAASTGDSLVAKGRVLVSPGYYRVLPPESAADDAPVVPPVDVGATWSVPEGTADVKLAEGWTKPPPRFTEASLVAQLEAEGVGRPSTYANTLRTLIDRAYAFLDARVFVVTPLGRLVCDRLVRHFPAVCDLGFTASVEASFDQIAQGKQDHIEFLDAFYARFHPDVESAGADAAFRRPEVTLVDGYPCPACGGPRALVFVDRQLVVACRHCPDPVELSWAPKRARRKTPKVESDRKGAEEQAAADQRLQDRCSTCHGSMTRWKLSTGGHLHLCQAWPLCSGYLLQAAKPAAAGDSSRKGRRRG